MPGTSAAPAPLRRSAPLRPSGRTNRVARSECGCLWRERRSRLVSSQEPAVPPHSGRASVPFSRKIAAPGGGGTRPWVVHPCHLDAVPNAPFLHPQSPDLRRLRHRRRLARQHHPRVPRTRCSEEAGSGLRRVRGRLARRLPAGHGPGQARRSALDEHRRPASAGPGRDPRPLRRARVEGSGKGPSEPRVAPLAALARRRARTAAPEEEIRHRHVVERKRRAADQYGQERGAALGLCLLGRAVPSLQARSRRPIWALPRCSASGQER